MKYILLIFLLLINTAHADEIDYESYFYDAPHNISDPLEKINRHIFNFNVTVDNAMLKPLAAQYVKVEQFWLSECVTNFSSNLEESSNLINAVLLGDFDIAINAFWRFFINSTLGIVGLFDVADLLGIHKVRRSFDDTMKYYGIDSGPYLVLPLSIPSSVRGLIASGLEILVNPLFYLVDNLLLFFAIKLTLAIPQRAEFLHLKLDSGVDPYVRWRSIFSQQDQWGNNENL